MPDQHSRQLKRDVSEQVEVCRSIDSGVSEEGGSTPSKDNLLWGGSSPHKRSSAMGGPTPIVEAIDYETSFVFSSE